MCAKVRDTNVAVIIIFDLFGWPLTCLTREWRELGMRTFTVSIAGAYCISVGTNVNSAAMFISVLSCDEESDEWSIFLKLSYVPSIVMGFFFQYFVKYSEPAFCPFAPK